MNRTRAGWGAERAEARLRASSTVSVLPLSPGFGADLAVVDHRQGTVTLVEVKSSADRWHADHPSLTPAELKIAREWAPSWALARYRRAGAVYLHLMPWSLTDYERDLRGRALRRMLPRGPRPL